MCQVDTEPEIDPIIGEALEHFDAVGHPEHCGKARSLLAGGGLGDGDVQVMGKMGGSGVGDKAELREPKGEHRTVSVQLSTSKDRTSWGKC